MERCGCGAMLTGRVRRGLCRPCYEALLAGGERAVTVLRGAAGARFAARVNTAGPGGCWEWTGGVDDQGYGVMRGEDGAVSAHRFAFITTHGDPGAMVVDHLCHDPAECDGGPTCPHRRCVNPTHLLAVPRAVNAQRASLTSPTAANAAKTHCLRGHPLTEDNVYRHPQRGTRHCRACRAERRAVLRVV